MVNTEIIAVNQAAFEANRVTNGQQALRLLLESDRVYTDIMTHKLYLEKDESFNLQLAVREWCDEIDPDWEFRLFVVDQHTTALTIYNDFFYDENIVIHKAKIEAMILECWSAVKNNIHRNVSLYCIDFALVPDLTRIFIIEVNAFQPPIAGSGLFVYANESDRKRLEKGPFSFRVRETPLNDFEQKTEQGHTRSLHPPLVKFIRKLQGRPAPPRQARQARQDQRKSSLWVTRMTETFKTFSGHQPLILCLTGSVLAWLAWLWPGELWQKTLFLAGNGVVLLLWTKRDAL